MPNIHKTLIRRLLQENPSVGSPVPGEAPSAMSNQPVLTEPTNVPGQPMNPQMAAGPQPTLYDLYPDLMNINPQDPCSLADYFATMCEQMQQQMQMQQQTAMVPSYAAQGTPNEF